MRGHMWPRGCWIIMQSLLISLNMRQVERFMDHPPEPTAMETVSAPTAYSRADIHMHTNLGDGWASPARVIEEATRRHLTLIAVTDHDHLEGAKRVEELLFKQMHPLQMITGVEVSTRQGHLLGLFVKK